MRPGRTRRPLPTAARESHARRARAWPSRALAAPVWSRCGLWLWLGLGLCAAASPAAARPRKEAPRFRGRLQILSGAAFALPADPSGDRSFVAYAPLDLEVGLRLSGPLSLLLGAAGYAAPFSIEGCTAGAPGPRPSALSSALGLRLDFNNSRDGSWLSPFVALRAGVVGQSGVPQAAPEGCAEHLLVAPWFSPRAGLDLWLGRAAATFAVGYDVLPRASAIAAQVGLTLRLF